MNKWIYEIDYEYTETIAKTDMGLISQYYSPKTALYGKYQKKFKTYQEAFKWLDINIKSITNIDLSRYESIRIAEYDLSNKILTLRVIWSNINIKYLQSIRLIYRKHYTKKYEKTIF